MRRVVAQRPHLCVSIVVATTSWRAFLILLHSSLLVVPSKKKKGVVRGEEEIATLLAGHTRRGGEDTPAVTSSYESTLGSAFAEAGILSQASPSKVFKVLSCPNMSVQKDDQNKSHGLKLSPNTISSLALAEQAWPWSSITFAYLDPMILKAGTGAECITMDDFGPLSSKDACERLQQDFANEWAKEVEKYGKDEIEKRSLWNVLWRTVGYRDFLMAVGLSFVGAVSVRFVQGSFDVRCRN